MKARLFAVGGLAALLIASIPAPAAEVPSIYDTLASRDGLSVMFVVATEAREVTALSASGAMTLFAPTDAAFKKLGDDVIKQIASDKALVRKLLHAHLVDGKYTTKELKDPGGKDLRTRQGTALKVELRKDEFRVGGVKVVTADVPCSNGVIHVIDTVLPLPKE